MEKRNPSNFQNAVLGGGQDTPAGGYLDPHPLSLSDDLTISLGFVK